MDQLLSFLDAAAAAAEGRRQAVLANRSEDLARMRAGVDAAIGAAGGLPGQSLRSRVEMVQRRIARAGPGKYGLPRCPGVPLVEQRLRASEANLSAFRVTLRSTLPTS